MLARRMVIDLSRRHIELADPPCTLEFEGDSAFFYLRVIALVGLKMKDDAKRHVRDRYIPITEFEDIAWDLSRGETTRFRDLDSMKFNIYEKWGSESKKVYRVDPRDAAVGRLFRREVGKGRGRAAYRIDADPLSIEIVSEDGRPVASFEALKRKYLRHGRKKGSYSAESTHTCAMPVGLCQGTSLDVPASLTSGADRVFSESQSELVLGRYLELALRSFGFIDLSALPQSAPFCPVGAVLIRDLYIPLRVCVRTEAGVVTSPHHCGAIEKGRDADRLQEAEQVGVEGPITSTARVPVGKRLGRSWRLVVVGDPGSGKTTLVRWLATAYLLRLRHDQDADKLPDIETLPCEDWLPLVVQGRDVNTTGLFGSLDTIFFKTLRTMEMTPKEANAMMGTLRQRMAEGKVLLLFDGLDEIADHTKRASLCRQIERFAAAYPLVPLVATSRVVGYQELGFRLGTAFEIVTVAELTADDKDEFARRWSNLTEAGEQAAKSAAELQKAIHCSLAAERLTSNPLLLCIVAMIWREIGELPQRRCDLYARAVEELLKWRAEVHDPIDRHEALPQLEYVGYTMCHRNVQRLNEDELLDILGEVRSQRPASPVNRHSPGEFLGLLKRQTNIIVEVGTERRASLLV